ncbi:GGDEF domain-containing protein [Mangrovicoccus ximenensis]|uniref:GGDEF domain-containing protein n=1 Tax=Mangrovicoccus ximenensis TaxID=1911570 RepID=UPI000D3D46D6|nr:GGDEF domain-containing protein [Mangrovicoccus ximenensis]
MEMKLERAALDLLMPMNLQADAEGLIVHVGPTLEKTRKAGYFHGFRLFELFRFKRPREVLSIEALRQAAGTPLRLYFRDDPQTQLRGEVTAAADGGLLLNLSFGLYVFDAIRHYRLHASDFATTDPTMDMLYLTEAKSAAMAASYELNLRLQAARIAAEEQAYTDTLTGLKNRRALDLVLARHRRQGTAFTLMGIDLDYFKRVNDTMGHAAGDVVLQHVARLMLERTGETDTLVRTGGDEFLIILAGQTDLTALRRRAGEMIAALETPIAVPDGQCQVSASIGLCSTGQFNSWEPAQMLADVDAALYAAKRAGRSQVVAYAPGMEPSGDDPERKAERLNARAAGEGGALSARPSR